MYKLESTRLAVVGLGYVGLPLAVEFGARFETLGFDIAQWRIDELVGGHDRTGETTPQELARAERLSLSADPSSLKGRNVYVITVPTPINEHKQPDFSPLVSASQTVGRALSQGSIVIYESTVFPGATEEICVPILEQVSGLKFNQDFAVGYSPERINPGDTQRRLPDIPKVTSASTPEAAEFVDSLYRQVVRAGTHLAPSIRVAEAAKVIENTQRDVNIALMNEFAMIFRRLGIDTTQVLEAAGTKWNFLPFKPGLVGGHCIGVDPYYLIQKAQSVGYFPDILLACRRVNDAMGHHVASEVVKLMIRRGMAVACSRVLVLGFTFKEDCPDLRNTRVIDLVGEFKSFGVCVEVFDPWADRVEARHEYGLELLAELPSSADYDAIVIAVGHDKFRKTHPSVMRELGKKGAVLYDVKGLYPLEEADGRL